MGGSGVVVLLLNDDTKFQKKKGAKIDRQDHRTITKTKDTCSIPRDEMSVCVWGGGGGEGVKNKKD